MTYFEEGLDKAIKESRELSATYPEGLEVQRMHQELLVKKFLEIKELQSKERPGAFGRRKIETIEEARRTAEKVYRLLPCPSVLVNLSKCAAELNKMDKAARLLKKARRDPLPED